MSIVYVLSIGDCGDCDDCGGYHIIDIFKNKSDAEEKKKKLELSDKNTYGFEVSSYSLEEYELK